MELNGKYHLVASLGHGGMADVFLAVLRGQSGFTKLVVVKSMRALLGDDDRFRNMMLDEARLAARLQHPNIVQTLEVGDAGGQPYIAMEYLDGQPLNSILNAARRVEPGLGVALVAHITREALAGLQYAHDLKDYDGTPLGIVHRDISPHNIFVTYEGEVKLVDFGIAKASTNVAQTEVGGVKGKIAYMAPEQARGEALDRRADLFAAGLVLWELLTTKRMFAGDSMAVVMQALLNEPLPRLGDVRPDLPASLDAVVSRSLAKKAQDRFQTADEMRDALQPFAGGVDRAELGRWMKTAFAAQREQMQAQIKKAMQPAEEASESSATVTMHTAPSLVLPEIGGSAASLPPGAFPAGAFPPGATSSVTPPLNATTTAPGVAGPSATWAMMAATLALLVAIGFVIYSRQPSATARVEPPASAPLAAAPIPSGDVILRLQGSETIGSVLGPTLVEAFLKQRGGTTSIVRGEDGKTRIVASVPGKGKPQIVELTDQGSATAFTGLASGQSDVGMSSRGITAEEAALLEQKGLGDLTSAVSEHVVGLDGVAVVVHPNSHVRALTFAQLASVFAGETTDWSALGQMPGPITIYVRDDKSGTFDLVKNAFGRPLAASARRFAENEALSDAVATDPTAIGFVAAASVRSAKAVAIRSESGVQFYATPFTIATEAYPLARRLYLYTPEKSANLVAADFVRFALSIDGQKVVRTAGFVDLALNVEQIDPCTSPCPPRYAALVRQARRISLDFRFRAGTLDLDSRAPDVDRLVAFLREHSGRLALLGFSDVGDAAASLKDSVACAKAVAEELRARGIPGATTEGFGSALPIASSSDTQRHDRNRRVEVWLLDDRAEDHGARPAPAPAQGSHPADPAPLRFER